MGSITAYSTSEGRRYRVRYRKPDNSQTDKRGFRTKRDAELFLASVEVTKARGEFIEASASRVKVDELGTAWLRARSTVVKPSYYRTLESAWRTHVLSRWGHRQIGSIRHSEVQDWISELAQTQSASSVLRAHGILASILDAAVRDRRINANPSRDVMLPRKVRKERAYLTHAQVEALATASTKPTLVRFLAYTGVRWGEAAGLRVKHLDLVRRRAQIRDNAVQVGGEMIIGTPKTHASRAVPVPRFLLAELEELTAPRQRDEFVFGPGDAPLRRTNGRDGWFAKAVQRAAANDPLFPAKLSPHDLRHTAASLAVSAGANVKAVQRMLGHASAAMTLDTYSDLFEDDLDVVSDALERAREFAAGRGRSIY